MKRALLVMATLAASTGLAQAGGYIGAGIGPTTSITDGTAVHARPQGRSARVMAGYRFGNLSIEGAISGVGVRMQDGDDRLLTGWVAGKLSFPLGNGFEAFGRIGGHHTQTKIGQPGFVVEGNGLMGGAGFEYNLNLVATRMSIFVDYTLAQATLTGDQPPALDTTLRTWTLGLTIGL